MLSQSGKLVGTSVLSQSGADDKLSFTIPYASGGAALQMYVYCQTREWTALAWLGATQRRRLNWSVDQCHGVSRCREAFDDAKYLMAQSS